MPTFNEFIGLAVIFIVFFVLSYFGVSVKPRLKHKQKYSMAVIYYCVNTGNRFVTVVESIDLAQIYANTLNLSTISAPMIINRYGATTHVLEAGVWSPVSQ